MSSSLNQFYEEQNVEQIKMENECKTEEDRDKLNKMYRLFHKDCFSND